MRKWYMLAFVFCLVLLGLGVTYAQTTLTMWHTWGAGTQRDKVVHSVMDAFMKAHPEIQVEIVPNSSASSAAARQKFMVAAVAGTPPDVAILGGLDIEWIDNGLIQPLTPFIKRDGINQSAFFPGIWEAMSFKDDLWVAPVSLEVSTQMLAINRDMFDEVGLNANKPPETVFDLQAADKKLTVLNSDGRIKRVGMFPFNIYGEWNAFSQWAARFGAVFSEQTPKGPRWNVKSPQALATLNWLNDWYQGVGHVNYAGTDAYRMRNNPSALLSYGATAMALWLNAYNQALNQLGRPINYRVAWLPYHPSIKKTDGIRVSTGFGLTMSAGAKYPEAAWQLIRFWIQSNEAAMIWGKDMGELTIKRGNPYMRSMLDQPDLYGTFVEYIANTQPPAPSVPGASVLSSSMSGLLPQLYQGKLTPEAVLTTVQDRLDAEFGLNK